MIDTHIHLDEEAYASDREEMISRQQDAGVEAMIIPGVNAASIENVMAVCHSHPGYCYPALGLHPQDVAQDWQQQWHIIETAIRAYRSELVAIGEIGLDYYYDQIYKNEQHEVLTRQLILARELSLPVIIHNRDATEDTLRILHDYPAPGVVHCFGGSRETAQQILDMGMYLGVGGVITFKNSKLADTLAGNSRYGKVPLERILLETDGPYLAPTPFRGERNESKLMIYVAERLAQVYELPVSEIIEQTTCNARQLFGIK